MFAYCNNNPINRCDPSGRSFIGVLGAAFASNPVGMAILVAATVAVICYGVYKLAKAATTTVANSIPSSKSTANSKTQEKEKTKAQEKDITHSQSASTVVYRYGGTNPGNLTPKEKDKYSGLSFSTIPMPGAARTTIEALNATGVVYTVKDSVTHVSVKPIGGTMEDWINAGSSSIWTQAVKSVVIKWDGGH